MKYEKPEVEVMQFDSSVFMAMSGNTSFSNAAEAIRAKCTGYNNGKPNNFDCAIFGDDPKVPPKHKDEVTVGKYVFKFLGQNWHCRTVD